MPYLPVAVLPKSGPNHFLHLQEYLESSASFYQQLAKIVVILL